MKKTVLLPLLTIIMAASMLIVGCSKDNNTEDNDIPIDQVVSVTLEPVASVTPMPEEEEDKYIITGKDLDPEVVAAFNEYICEHTVSMGRFLMDRYTYYDITGDGKPDLCTSVTHGSGIVSTGIFVYDIENGQGYQLQDRGESDYWVDSVKAGAVYIKKGFFGRRNMRDGAVGKLELVDGELRYNGPEPDKSDLPTPVIRPTASYTIDDIGSKERELSAFVKLRNFIPNVKCLLITNSEETRTEYNGISIEVLPAWKWLLRN